jgi:hypothetical protein
MATKECGDRAGQFITTKEHRRFTEFAEAVRRHRYIGLCYGPAGVGKTLSARRYAHWDLAGEAIENWDRRPDQEKINAALARSRTVFYTPTVLGALRDMRRTLSELMVRVEICIEDHLYRDDEEDRLIVKNKRRIEMLILDEAERLSMTALEFVRDMFDRTGIGVILIGMPGMEKRLSRGAVGHHGRRGRGRAKHPRGWDLMPNSAEEIPPFTCEGHTMSPAARFLSILKSSFRSARAPVAFSRYTRAHPAAFNCSSWASSVWP